MSKPRDFWTTTMFIKDKTITIPLPDPVHVIEYKTLEQERAKSQKLLEAFEEMLDAPDCPHCKDSLVDLDIIREAIKEYKGGDVESK